MTGEDVAVAQEVAELPREDKLPSWSVGTWVVVVGAICTLAGVVGAVMVTEYQVTQLELWRKEHDLEVKQRHEVMEARFRSVEDAQRAAERDHDHRLTQLEDHWQDIGTRLQRIENKLDEKHGH